MSADDAQPATVEVGHGPARPRSVTVAFWLWWPQLVYQAMFVSGLAISTVFAMIVGGPALDVLLYAVPIGVPLAIVTVIAVRQLFRLRPGSRRARTTPAIIAIAIVALTTWSDVFQVMMRLPSSGTVLSTQEGPEAYLGAIARDAVLAAAMLVATALTFSRSARAFFSRSPGAADPVPGDASPEPD